VIGLRAKMQGSFLEGNGTVRCGSPYSISTLTKLECEGSEVGGGVAFVNVLECLICGMIDRANNPSDFLHDHNGTVVILAFEMSIFKSVVSKAIVKELQY